MCIRSTYIVACIIYQAPFFEAFSLPAFFCCVFFFFNDSVTFRDSVIMYELRNYFQVLSDPYFCLILTNDAYNVDINAHRATKLSFWQF